jgi:hypothetical protein
VQRPAQLASPREELPQVSRQAVEPALSEQPAQRPALSILAQQGSKVPQELQAWQLAQQGQEPRQARPLARQRAPWLSQQH